MFRQRVKQDGRRAMSVRNTWRDDVKHCILQLNKREFSSGEIYLFEGDLKQRHPGNNNVREAIRLMLQQLRDEGFIDFVSWGRYRLR
jgi:type II restriction enzyme